MKRLFAILLVAVLATSLAFAGSPTANTPAGATLVTPIAIELTTGTSLEFGHFTATAAGGTILLDPANTAPVFTGVTEIVGVPSHSTPEYTVTGTALETYDITLPANGDVTIEFDGNTMAVNDFTHSAGTAPVLNATGIQVFQVGAKLIVGAGQVDGAYVGTFDVTVAYN